MPSDSRRPHFSLAAELAIGRWATTLHEKAVRTSRGKTNTGSARRPSLPFAQRTSMRPIIMPRPWTAIITSHSLRISRTDNTPIGCTSSRLRAARGFEVRPRLHSASSRGDTNTSQLRRKTARSIFCRLISNSAHFEFIAHSRRIPHRPGRKTSAKCFGRPGTICRSRTCVTQTERSTNLFARAPHVAATVSSPAACVVLACIGLYRSAVLRQSAAMHSRTIRHPPVRLGAQPSRSFSSLMSWSRDFAQRYRHVYRQIAR